jgi:hypothetical protein
MTDTVSTGDPMPLPGDILVTRDKPFWARLIRFGAALHDQPDSWNHVVIASHTDAMGVMWGIEGRPGGVGWVDLAPLIANRWTITNMGQPKTGEQRGQVITIAKGLLGTPYDWAGIVKDAMEAMDIGKVWRMRDWGDTPPGHVVCSSLAAWVYNRVGLMRPGGLKSSARGIGDPTTDRAHALRTTTPADWAEFIQLHPWN